MKRSLAAFSLIIILFSCVSKPHDQLPNKIFGNLPGADTVMNIIAIANCKGPSGNYTTEVHSDTGGYTYFRQVYTYRDAAFEAVAINADSAFQVTNDTLAGTLDAKTIVALKSHEFHKILFDLKERFHQFGEPERMTIGLGQLYQIKALNVLNDPILLIVGKDRRVQSVSMVNPSDTTEVIIAVYSDWQPVQGMMLPMHVDITQGKDKKFMFDFTTVKINSKEFRRWTGPM